MIAAIPARYASTRLPGKPLLPLAGRPMIEHVYRRARAAGSLDAVVVLTDDRRIADAVTGFGGSAAMTPESCASGTDRIAHWLAREDPDDVRAVLNIQGDEPLIEPEVVERVARHLVEHPEDPMVTLAYPLPAGAPEIADPNRVKVVLDQAGYALYFSRSEIPYRRNPPTETDFDSGSPTGLPTYGHVGIYGYRRDTLLELAALPPAPLERAESLEQLRALAHGIRIRVLATDRPTPGVDTAEDLARAERLLTHPNITGHS